MTGRRADFLLGLFHLKERQGEQAIYRFSSAYTANLDFETEGTELYQSISERPALRTLHENLLPLFHAIDKYGGKFSNIHGQVGAKIVDWIGNRKKEEQKESQSRERTHSSTDGR